MNISRKEMYDRVAVGQRIKEQRILKNMSQVELSEKIGRYDNYIYDVEHGKNGMSLEIALSVASVLDMSLDYLFFGPDSFKKKDYSEASMVIMKYIDSCKPQYRDAVYRITMQLCSEMSNFSNERNFVGDD